MKITLDVNQPLTTVEKDILTVLLGGTKTEDAPVAKPEEAPVAKPEEAPVEEVVVTKEEVASLAQSLMKQPGGRDKVKDALSALGASRVREIGDDRLSEFYALLQS